MTPSNLGLRASPPGDPRAWPSHAAVEVHPVDTNRRIVLDTQINMLRDAEAEVAGLGEVLLAQLVFLDLEASLQDFFRFGTSDGDVDGNLFVAADAERTDGVASFACEAVSNS